MSDSSIQPGGEHIQGASGTASQDSDAHLLTEDISHVEALTNELKRLLVKHENTLQEQGIRQQVEMLERWMESYRRGLAAAKKISSTGKTWLCELRDQLKLAANEMQRLEAEGGAPATKDQARQMEDMIKAVRRIEKVIPDMDEIFCKSHTAALEEAQS